MKPQDLTIGDRVMYHGKLSVITEIRRTVAEVEWDSDSELVDFGDIKPISLTIQILQKNAKTVTKDGCWIYYEFSDMYAIKNCGEAFFFCEIKNGFNEVGDISWLALDYFHQLQQALRLVGLYEVADNLRP